MKIICHLCTPLGHTHKYNLKIAKLSWQLKTLCDLLTNIKRSCPVFKLYFTFNPYITLIRYNIPFTAVRLHVATYFVIVT